MRRCPALDIEIITNLGGFNMGVISMSNLLLLKAVYFWKMILTVCPNTELLEKTSVLSK